VKTAIMIAIMVAANSAGDVLLTKGMREVGEVSTFVPRELFLVARKALHNYHFLASVFFMTVFFAGFLSLLSWADLSFVFPAMALAYVVSTLAAKFILGETVSLHRWAGTLLICLGVGLVSLP
jgi:drug/metabolite transporter (DMT)-like permease